MTLRLPQFASFLWLVLLWAAQLVVSAEGDSRPNYSKDDSIEYGVSFLAFSAAGCHAEEFRGCHGQCHDSPERCEMWVTASFWSSEVLEDDEFYGKAERCDRIGPSFNITIFDSPWDFNASAPCNDSTVLFTGTVGVGDCIQIGDFWFLAAEECPDADTSPAFIVLGPWAVVLFGLVPFLSMKLFFSRPPSVALPASSDDEDDEEKKILLGRSHSPTPIELRECGIFLDRRGQGLLVGSDSNSESSVEFTTDDNRPDETECEVVARRVIKSLVRQHFQETRTRVPFPLLCIGNLFFLLSVLVICHLISTAFTISTLEKNPCQPPDSFALITGAISIHLNVMLSILCFFYIITGHHWLSPTVPFEAIEPLEGCCPPPRSWPIFISVLLYRLLAPRSWPVWLLATIFFAVNFTSLIVTLNSFDDIKKCRLHSWWPEAVFGWYFSLIGFAIFFLVIVAPHWVGQVSRMLKLMRPAAAVSSHEAGIALFKLSNDEKWLEDPHWFQHCFVKKKNPDCCDFSGFYSGIPDGDEDSEIVRFFSLVRRLGQPVELPRSLQDRSFDSLSQAIADDFELAAKNDRLRSLWPLEKNERVHGEESLDDLEDPRILAANRVLSTTRSFLACGFSARSVSDSEWNILHSTLRTANYLLLSKLRSQARSQARSQWSAGYFEKNESAALFLICYTLELLMAAGADPCERNGDGRTAQEYAEHLRLPREILGTLSSIASDVDDRSEEDTNARNFVSGVPMGGKFGAGALPILDLDVPEGDARERSTYDFFMSHAGADKKEVLRLTLFLEAQGFEFFLDLHSIKDSIEQNIISGLSSSRFVLLFMTQGFFHSKWACAEAWSKMVHHWRMTQKHDFPIISLLLMEQEQIRNSGPFVDQRLVGMGDGEPPWNMGGTLSTVRYPKFLRGVEGAFEVSHMCEISRLLADQLGDAAATRVQLFGESERMAKTVLREIDANLSEWETDLEDLADVPEAKLKDLVQYLQGMSGYKR